MSQRYTVSSVVEHNIEREIRRDKVIRTNSHCNHGIIRTIDVTDLIKDYISFTINDLPAYLFIKKNDKVNFGI